MSRWAALLIALAGAFLLAIVATTPPSPAPVDVSPAAFSAARAMADIRVIGREPHVTGSPADAAVRNHLVHRLRALGLAVTTVTAPLSGKGATRLAQWRGTRAPAPLLTNVVALLPGRDRTSPAVMLMAHHDSVWGSPGAADDSAGVVSALETVRAIRAAGGQPRRDLLVLFTDGEELGLEGVKAFFATDPRRGHVGVIVNMETRGGGGRTAMFETGPHNGGWMALFGRSVMQPQATSLSVFVYQHLPNSTDYTVAKTLGVPGFNFAFIGRPALYHSPMATPERLDQGALQDMGRQVLDLSRGLLATPALPGPAPDRTFFDGFGLFLVAYPAWIGWLILAAAAIGYGVAGRGRPVGRGVIAMLSLIVAAALLLWLANLASGADGPVNYYDRLAAIPRLTAQALLIGVATLVLVGAGWLRGRAPGEAAVGAAIPLLVTATVAQALAPTAAFVLAWPLVLGGGSMAIARQTGGRTGITVLIGAAMLGVGWLLALGFLLMEAVGPVAPMVAVLPLALAPVLLLPLTPPIPVRGAGRFAAVLLMGAVALALWVRLDPIAPTVAVYSKVGAAH